MSRFVRYLVFDTVDECGYNDKEIVKLQLAVFTVLNFEN